MSDFSTDYSGGRQQNDENASMRGDTSSHDNVNNEGSAPDEPVFSSDSGSDRFSSDGASYATSAGQEGAGGIGSSGEYSSARGADRYSSESKPEYSSGDVSSANYGTEIEGDSQAGGRQSGDSESSKYGDTSSQTNINNEYPSSAEEGANFSTDSNSASFGLGGSSSATSADGGRTSEEGDYTGGGEYEGAKGYGLSQVEKSEPEQGVFRD